MESADDDTEEVPREPRRKPSTALLSRASSSVRAYGFERDDGRDGTGGAEALLPGGLGLPSSWLWLFCFVMRFPGPTRPFSCRVSRLLAAPCVRLVEEEARGIRFFADPEARSEPAQQAREREMRDGARSSGALLEDSSD